MNDLLKKAIAAKSQSESRLQNLSSNIPEKYQSQGVLLSALESMGSKQLERKQQNAFNEMYPMLQRDIVERDLRSARYAEANLRFDSLGGIAVDGDGNIYVTDGDAHQVKKITKDKDGLYVVLATGTGRAQLADGSASCAMFDTPNDLTITPSGNIVIADAGNNCIRQLYRNGTVTTLAGSSHRGQRDGRGTRADFWYPTSVACDAKGRIFVADSRNCKIRIIQTDGEVTTFAGTGQFGNQDGYRLQASFKNPFDITADAKGTTIYVAQSIIGENIRKITPDGLVTSLAGCGTTGFRDGLGEFNEFNQPQGIALDSSGNLLVADAGNHAVRAVTPEGYTFTIVGHGGLGKTDGPAETANLNYPTDIATDIYGNLYIADCDNKAIRVLVRNESVAIELGLPHLYSSFNRSLADDVEPLTQSYVDNSLDSDEGISVKEYRELPTVMLHKGTTPPDLLQDLPEMQRYTPPLDGFTPPYIHTSKRATSPVPEAFKRWGSVERALETSWRDAEAGYYKGEAFQGPPESWSGYSEIQEIYPQVFLSNLLAAEESNLLEEKGISHAINVVGLWELQEPEERAKNRTGEWGNRCRDRLPAGIELEYLEILIGGPEEIDLQSPQIIHFIETAIHSGGNVLICCRTGVFLGPAVAAVYLMYANSIRYEFARARILKKRPIVNIPDWLNRQLFKADVAIKALGSVNPNYHNPDAEDYQDPDEELAVGEPEGMFNSDDWEEERIRGEKMIQFADPNRKGATIDFDSSDQDLSEVTPPFGVHPASESA